MKLTELFLKLTTTVFEKKLVPGADLQDGQSPENLKHNKQQA